MKYEYGQYVWDHLILEFKNQIAVAGIMGNLAGESGIIPYRVENDNIPPYEFSHNYTTLVDNGSITENDFIYNSPSGYGKGYGLAQWTYDSRKQNMYNYWKTYGGSIGSIEFGVDWLIKELKEDYTPVYNQLLTIDDLRTASDLVLHDYEGIHGQEEVRYELSLEILKEYGKPQPVIQKNKKIPLWMMCHYGI